MATNDSFDPIPDAAPEPVARCSTQAGENLPGTAKPGQVYVVLEYLHGWGHDVLDDDVFGPELAAKVRAHLKKYGAGLQLVRKPGRAGQHREQRYLYVVHTGDGVRPPHTRRLLVSGPEAIVELDLSAPGACGGEVVEHPLLLVCTHGKRDMCCALRGRPVAASLQACFYGDEVWESSHTKGHRFAPSMICLPWGYSFGKLNSAQALEMLKAFSRGQLPLEGNRGRGCFDAPGQVAELTIARELVDGGEDLAPGSLSVDPVDVDGETVREVTHPDGRSWRVSLEQVPGPLVAASCGDVPKPSKTWVPRLVRRR